ncbi:MAG: hypothetical protein IJT15_03605 [Rickettsiales bacterium]|nr:hypothetical protein [Rickettsiales bacterium]
MANNYKDRLPFADFCKTLKIASHNAKFDAKLKEIKYHKRIDEKRKELLNNNKVKSIIEDLRTQTIFRNVCNKYNIYPIEKSNKDNYTYILIYKMI